MTLSNLRVASILLCLTLSSAFMSMRASAGVVDPPSAFLFKSQHAVVAATVVGASADGTLELRVTETLHGTAPGATLRVRTEPQWLTEVRKDDRVLVAYSLYRRSLTKPKSLEPRPGGPLILVSSGLEPALFIDTFATRALLSRKPDASYAHSREWLGKVIAGLNSPDPKLQNFFAAELVLRAPLHPLLRPRDRAAIERLVRNPRAYTSARSSLLAAAATQPQFFGKGWPQSVALEVLAETSVKETDVSVELFPSLVRTAFVVLENDERDVPVTVARRWLASTHLGLVESALLAIRRSAPELEREVAEQALAHPELTQASRDFLRDHLRRLAIMQDALQAANAASEGRG